jgi:hypothetical protein
MKRAWTAALLGAALPFEGCTIEWKEGSGGSGRMGRVQVERVDELPLPIGLGGSLHGRDLAGDVDVRVEEGSTATAPRLRARWRGWGDDTAEAQQALAASRIEVTGDSASTEFRAIAPESRDGFGARADLELIVPADLSLDLIATLGHLVVHGPCATASLDTRYGDVRVDAIDGDVRARSSSGDLDLSAVGGAVDAETAYGDVTVRACRGATVRAQSSSGDIAVSDGGEARYELGSRYGDVTLRGGSGALDADTASGRIDVSRFTGSVRARDRYGAIDLAGTFSSVDAATSSGDVSLRLEGIDDALREITLDSKYGDVELVTCVELAGRLTATTRYGDVRFELPATDVRREQDGDRIEARLGEGDVPIRLATASGDVRVLKGGR